MFILTTISDLVQISPEDLGKSNAEAIEDNLNSKYANKVIQSIGLGICFYDLLKASDGLLGHGTGIVNVNVEFRLVVFRPFKGEIIMGRLSSASEEGMKVRLDFFDDISIPSNMLFPNTTFNDREQVWVWHNDGVDLYFDKLMWVRVRIEHESWHDASPMTPSEGEEAENADRLSPFSLTASMMQSGLGPVEWWE